MRILNIEIEFDNAIITLDVNNLGKKPASSRLNFTMYILIFTSSTDN